MPNLPSRLQLSGEVTIWLIVFVLGLRLYFWLGTPENHIYQVDFAEFFYVAGHRLLEGLSPYDFSNEEGEAFFNPPWFALIVSPLSLLPPASAMKVWLFLNLTLLCVTVWLAVLICDARHTIGVISAGFLLAANWWPNMYLLQLGQSSLWSIAFAYAAIYALQHQRGLLAGLLMVIASSKPQLMFLLGPGMVLNEWRRSHTATVVRGFIAGVVLLTALCLAFSTTWVSDLLTEPRTQPRVGGHLSMNFLLATIFGPQKWIDIIFWLFCTGGSLVVLHQWQNLELPLPQLAGFTLAATLLLTPCTQLYDYGVLILPVIWLSVECLRLRRSRTLWLFGALALCFFSSADRWFHHLLEHEILWRSLCSLVGEETVIFLYEQSKWNWRFIAVAIPVSLVCSLVSIGGSWRKSNKQARS